MAKGKNRETVSVIRKCGHKERCAVGHERADENCIRCQVKNGENGFIGWAF